MSVSKPAPPEPVAAAAADDSTDDGSDNDALIAQALNPDGTPRRPMNAFMIFARRRRPEITANNPPLRTGEISKVLSSEWAAMSAESKQFYLDRARKLKDNFNARWPDYVYRRRPNNTRKRKRTDGASAAGPPVVRRCASPGREPVVPSSKIKYEDGYSLPCVPGMPSGAPLTMLALGDPDHGRNGLLGGYNGSPLPSMLPGQYGSRTGGTPSLMTSASTSPRSASSSLHTSYRYGDHALPLTNSPPHQGHSKMGRAWKESTAEPGSSGQSFPPSNASFSSPYEGLSYLPKASSGAFDEYAASRAPDLEPRHGEWTPPHGVQSSVPLPAFGAQGYAYDGDDGGRFEPYAAGEPHLGFSAGLLPVHAFPRS